VEGGKTTEVKVNLSLARETAEFPQPFSRQQVKLYEGRKLIAVLELQSSSEKLIYKEVQYLTDVVRKDLTDAIDPEKYIVMTREIMDVIVPPEERKCFDAYCYAVVAKRLQARFLIAGNVKDFGERIGVTLEAYDGPTGAVLGIEQGEAQDIQELLKKVRAMARRLGQRF
jgi:TolB-like protein